MKLSELENRLNLKFPQKWHKIYNTGAMEWLELDKDSYTKDEFRVVMKKYINNPTQFFMMECDCEPLAFEKIADKQNDLNEWISWKCEDEKVRLKEGVNLMPFAQTGGGDLFCFLFENDIENAKIALYYHDYYETPDIYAESFDEFLYRALLEAASYADKENDEFIDSEYFNNHLEYLTDKYKILVEGKELSELADDYQDLILKKADIWEKI